MRSSHKNLHGRDEELEQELEDQTGEVDRTCRKEFERRNIDETVTDVRSAIERLPKRYFKRIATNTSLCLQNTHSGLKTIVERIKRVKQKKVKERKRTNLINNILTGVVVILILALVGGAAYFFINSLLQCYNPTPQPEKQAEEPQNP